jgi:hypothetical protein
VQHTTLGYYGKGITYGCIGGTLMMIGDTWWWCKNYNGYGIFRFKKSDILPSAIAAGGAAAPESGVALEGMNPKSLAYSSKSNKYIFTLFDANHEGVYVCTLDQLNGIGASKNALAPYKKMFGTLGFVPNKSGKPAAVEGHTSEFAAICQIAYDEVNDCAYFAFRNNHNDAASAPTGIYRYNFATDKIEQVLTGTNIYGMVVNNIPAKLF